MSNLQQSNQRRIEIIIIIGVIVCIAAYFGFNMWQDKRSEKEIILRTESEMRYKQLAEEYHKKALEIDTLKQEKASLEAVIEFQKNNPSVIINKYATIHQNLDALNALNSIALFSGNTARYNSDKNGRHSLSRFVKHN